MNITLLNKIIFEDNETDIKIVATKTEDGRWLINYTNKSNTSRCWNCGSDKHLSCEKKYYLSDGEIEDRIITLLKINRCKYGEYMYRYKITVR